MSRCATTLVVIATILGPITLAFMAVSFATHHWIEFDVDRSKLPNRPNATEWRKLRYYTSRDRGLFLECYPDNNTEWLDYAKDVVDSNCFDIEYDWPDSVDDPSDYYLSRLHLNRCFLAFYIVALVMFVVSFIFGLVLCCMRISRWAYIAGLFAYCSAFALAAAIAFFHGAEYIERNKLDNLNAPEEQEFYPNWPLELKNATDREYGYSYALGWVGMILASLTATLYSIAGCYITGERYEDKEVLQKRGPGHDFPIAMEPVPVYAVGADAYYGKAAYGYQPRAAYVGPMAPEYYHRGYPDMYQWREYDS